MEDSHRHDRNYEEQPRCLKYFCFRQIICYFNLINNLLWYEAPEKIYAGEEYDLFAGAREEEHEKVVADIKIVPLF